MNRMKTYLIARRYEHEEPHYIRLVFAVSDGLFSGTADIYIGIEQITALGKGLNSFPANISDEYYFEHGSEKPEDRAHSYFMIRAYVADSLGHCAKQFHINQNRPEPSEGLCKFLIQAGAAAINRLGDLFLPFSELKYFEFCWPPTEAELFEYHHG